MPLPIGKIAKLLLEGAKEVPVGTRAVARAAETALPGAAEVPSALPGARRAGSRAPRSAPIQTQQQALPVDNTLGLPPGEQVPVTFRGKEPADWEPHDFHDFGQQHGVPNLGPANSQEWQSTLQPMTLLDGRAVTIPPVDRPWTYYDLQHIQAQGIDPTKLPAGAHTQIHNKILETMQPQGAVSPERVANGYIMGLTSPNNPLTPNQLAVQRAMVKGPQDIERLANLSPTNYKDVKQPTKAARLRTSDKIAKTLGLGKAPAGLGARGSTDLTTLPGLAQRAMDNPDFYKFDAANFPGMSPAEAWAAHTERVLNATPGLKAKTASFGGVWQSPQDAAISAVDRHIAGALHGSMFPNPKEQAKWEKATIDSFNKMRSKAARKAGKEFTPVTSIEQLRDTKRTPGGLGHYTDAAMGYVNKLPTAVTRNKAGDFNPRVPATLQNAQWPGGIEPQKMQMLAGPYSRVLDENAKMAAEKGQGLFSNQWFNWDPLRKRLEPHGIMFPGLEKLPRMSLEQMKQVRKQYRDAGYFKNRGAVRPISSAAKASFFGIPLGLFGAGAASKPGEPPPPTY